MCTDIKPSIEYARSLYDDVVYWYKNADTKAQILLTLMGVFVGFLTSSIIVGATDLNEITDCIDMNHDIWIVLSIMTATVTLSVLSALACLWSRISKDRGVGGVAEGSCLHY